MSATIQNRFFRSLARRGAIALAALCVWGRADSAIAFTYDDLAQLVRSRHIRSLEELLPELPVEFRANYTLLFKSRSLQGATPLAPRVILYSADARLTCAFGGALEAGADTLECFQYLDQDRRFDFRQIAFPTSENQRVDVLFSESGRSAVGATSCASCHGLDPRPNWDSYPYWPGAYGESDDFLTGASAKNYDSFVSLREQDPRYKWLVQGPSRKSPYNGDTFQHTNLKLSDLVGRMNSARAARLLEERLPEWQVLGFAVGALGCSVTSIQKAQLAAAHHDFDRDTNREMIFERLKIAPNDWTTHIFDDLTVKPGLAFEQQSGEGYLSIGAAMSIILQKAKQGNVPLQTAVAQMIPYTSAAPSREEKDYFDALTSIQPDPNWFGEFYKSNAALLCPELVHLFVTAATLTP